MQKADAKHTKGPWFAFVKGSTVAVGTGRTGHAVDKIVHWFGFDACGVSLEEQAANARLIAEAGTVATETGMTPRQLADALIVWGGKSSRLELQVAELLAALTEAMHALHEAEAILGGEYGDHYGPFCEQMIKLEADARAAIAKASAA